MRINALITLSLLLLLTTRHTLSQPNLHHPEFTYNEYTQDVSEDATIGTIVLTVEATDDDNHGVTYSIEGESHSYFALDPSSGVVTVDHELDRESMALIEFDVIAVDDGASPQTSTTRVIIAILDVNDNKPEFVDFDNIVTLREDAAISLITPIATFEAMDDDAGTNSQVTYSLEGNPNYRFSIDEVNGNLFLNGTLDFEVQEMFSLLIVATDKGTPALSRQQGVTITVTNVDDSPPEFQNLPATVSIPEDTAATTAIFSSISAVDQDSVIRNTITYTIQSGDSLGQFSITGDVLSVAAQLDFEDKTEYELVIHAQEDTTVNPMQQTATATITVEITDVNDVAPDLPLNVLATVSESIEVGHSVVQLEFTDVDTVASSYVFTIQTAGAKFAVDNTGLITIASTLDFETLTPETFDVQMCEATLPTLCDTTTVQVTVTDENDNSPTFSATEYRATITEEQMNADFLTVTGSDIDSGLFGGIVYSIEGVESASFSVVAATGVISNIVGLDRETNPVIDLLYVATDTDLAHPRRTTVPLIITLDDINDQTPAFLSIPSPFAFDVPEESAQDVFTFSVTDGDLSNNAAVTVTVDNADFRVDTATGTEFTLKTSGALDRETTPSYTLVLTATDSGTTPLASMVTCTVTVTDINDETPVFGAPQAVTFPENTATTTAIDTITATDADIGANARLTYLIESGDVDGVFVIDSDTGAISLQNSLDYETTQSYTLEVIALDAADPPLTGTGTVTVTITDFNDNTPTFDLIRYEFDVTELAVVDSVVGTVIATDGDIDSPNKDFTFSITSGNTGTTFKLSTTNQGEILIDTPPLFDVTPSYTLTITVTDGGTPALLSTVLVAITIVDTNNNAPMLLGIPYSFTVTEGTHADTPIGIITATDVDSDTVTEFIFSIVDSTGTFQIDPVTGVITTIAADIDRESTSSYTLTAQVDDSATSPNQDTETVTVTVVDVNDNNPVFTGTPYTVTPVPENSLADVAVFTVSATDADEGANAMVTFFIIGGNQHGYFQIDASTGAITTTATMIDHEEIMSVTITVEARDAGAVPRATDIEVVIPIEDLNDNTPSFLGIPYSTTVAEESAIGTTVFTIIKQDADSTLVVTLSIIAGDTDAVFRTEGMNVILNNTLDRETTASYTLTLQLDDTATQATTGLDITVIDFNDNPPVLGSNTVTFTFSEGRTPAPITTIQASDIDEGVNSRLHYDIDDTHGVFELGRTTGELTQVSFFDMETDQSYTLTITVTDGGFVAMSVIITITITITDVNELTPTFESDLFREGIAEDQTVPYDFVSDTLALDGDFEAATNGKIIHSIVSVQPFTFTGDFSINEDTGQLTLMNMLDYESIQEAVITIMAVDQPVSGTALSSTARVIFTVSDVNDNSPIFVSNTHTLSIFENAASPATIGVFTATDLDSGVNGEITYSNSATMPAQFTYDTTTGVLTQTATFDRENLPHTNPVTFQVIATDGGGVNQGTADVTLTILDQNDNAPVFSQSTYSISINEDFTLGDIVLTVSATEANTDDGTSAVVEYAITHGGDGHFAIGVTSGEITSLLTFNREEEDTFELTVAAFDQSVNPLSTFVAVTITIVDVNDNPPVFTFSTYQVSVSEGASPQNVVSDVDIFATDQDLPANVDITYDITDVTFSATTTAGKIAQIVSDLAIDFEATPSFTVEITAKDTASGGMTGTATLVITVIDVNDNPPVFNTSVTAFSFPESTSGGTVLFTISATDADSTTNGDITYSVTSGDDGRFAVQPDTGIVTTTSLPFDFETTTSYTVVFTAVDAGSPPMSDTITITIDITDVNDNPPVYSTDPIRREVDENDASLTFDISATDSDSTATFNQIIYAITAQTESDLFVINNTTGIVSLLRELDRESAGLEILSTGLGLHEFVVQATDPDNPAFTATTHVLISVKDLNDNNPVIERECPLSFTLQENVTAHEEVLTTIPASDADFAQTLFYIIVSGNEDGEFRISQVGLLEVFGDQLNREVKPDFDLLLEVRDGGTPELTSTCHILITVDDSNDFAPVFPDNPSMTIPEDTSIDTELLTYTASDNDIGINADIVYTINSGNIGTKFELGQFTGVLKVVGEFDFETLPGYSLEIFATDKGTPPMTGTGTITITITDVNDNAPVLTSVTAINFAENILETTQVYTAIATDADSGVNKDITYSILGTNFGIFVIDMTTGILSIIDSTDIDREVTDEYQLTIVATDGGTSPLDDSLTLTVTIDDINDNPPVFPHNDLTLEIVEDTAAEEYIGQILLTFSGSDQDIGVNGDFEFRIDAGNDDNLFTLTTAGVLTRSASIDREVYDSITLTLTIYDLGTNSMSSSISLDIDITDSNDNTPIFGNTTYTFDVIESSNVTFLIGTITASDTDEGVNQDISFAIPDTTQPFAIDSTSGELTVKIELDRETTDRYEFELEGYDAAVHPRTGTTTVIINILDFNDNEPYFVIKEYDFEIPEHFMLDTTFGMVEATDDDLAPNNVRYYYIETGDETFAVGHETGEISLVRDLDRENSTDVRRTGTVIASNSMTYPVAPFDFAFSRTQISTTISDINDNPPIFTSSWYRGGVISDTEFDSVVLSVVASDLDVINETYFGGEIGFLAIPETSASEFRVGSTGNIHLAADVTAEVGNYFNLFIIASDNRLLDPHHNVTTRTTLWVLTTAQQTVITIENTKPEVLEMIDVIIQILENITGSLINIDQVIYNPINNEHTDVYFHAVDGSTLAIVARTSVIRVVDENRVSVDSLFKDFVVSSVEPASSPVVSLDPFLLGLSVVLAVLVLICCCLLILCVIYDQVRRKQIKHRQRVSLLKSYDASLDYNYSLSGQTYENPMWLHPYEQWEKEDDQFTKGNPLFYESQEFVMDMFRESDDEKSEETISFGSWGASRTKIRGRVGRTAKSGTSTITRMSDVNQDYNVDLLAEVLGDDLPPSGAEPSEVSNI